jgi:hypothetical protein
MRLTRLPTRWWLALLLAGILTANACGSSGPRQDQAPESPTYEAEAFVLDDPGRDPVMCLGSFADSLPPQCDGTPLAGWDWDTVEGRGDGAAFDVGIFPPRRHLRRDDVHGAGSGAAEAAGRVGRRPRQRGVRPSRRGVDLAGYLEGRRRGRSRPDAGDGGRARLRRALDRLRRRAGGRGTVEPGGIIANVAFTGDLERHTAQIRERWGGPLCVVQYERTYAELRRIQRELGTGRPRSSVSR